MPNFDETSRLDEELEGRTQYIQVTGVQSPNAKAKLHL